MIKRLWRHNRRYRYQRLFSYSEISSADYERYLSEIKHDERLKITNKRLDNYGIFHTPPIRATGLYILTRYYKPDICVETGVRHGLSSAYILAALERNDKGRLYSIDMPSTRLSDSQEPGWAVSDRKRWDLRIGRSQDRLEPLLEEINAPELFYHDSHHKYPLMRYEFTQAKAHMSHGIIASDDINRNHAFLELCSEIDSPVHISDKYRIGGKGTFGFAEYQPEL